MSFARRVSPPQRRRRTRAVGLDIHWGFCEVAIGEDGHVRPAPWIGTTPAEFEAFGAGLGPDDVVTLEATGNAAAIARILHLVKQRTKAKNQVHAALIRNLVGRPPASDLFGRRGRAWLAGIELPADERDGVDASLRVIDFLTAEIDRLDAVFATAVLGSADMRRLMTLPGISATTAVTLVAVIGNIG